MTEKEALHYEIRSSRWVNFVSSFGRLPRWAQELIAKIMARKVRGKFARYQASLAEAERFRGAMVIPSRPAPPVRR